MKDHDRSDKKQLSASERARERNPRRVGGSAHAADRLCAQCLLEFGQYRDIDTNEILKLVTPEQGVAGQDIVSPTEQRSAEYEETRGSRQTVRSKRNRRRGSAFEEKHRPTACHARRSTRVVTSALRGEKERARAPSASERAARLGGGKLLPGSVGGSRKRRVGRGRVGLQNGVRRVTE